MSKWNNDRNTKGRPSSLYPGGDRCLPGRRCGIHEKVVRGQHGSCNYKALALIQRSSLGSGARRWLESCKVCRYQSPVGGLSIILASRKHSYFFKALTLPRWFEIHLPCAPDICLGSCHFLRPYSLPGYISNTCFFLCVCFGFVFFLFLFSFIHVWKKEWIKSNQNQNCG